MLPLTGQFRAVSGLILRLSLPLAGGRVTSSTMFLIAAVAIISPVLQAPPRMMSAGVSVQATATIRVISGVRVSFGAEPSSADVPQPRQTVVKIGDSQQPAKLIEFQ